MKVTGIIAEFNPFHNGHKYLCDTARKNGADMIVIVMSGEFVQSGEPAFASKEMRARAAVYAGADYVFLLPAYYSTASAELFAYGAISLLDSIGVVDNILFGAENTDIELMKRIAAILNDEPEGYKLALKKYLKKGISFPAARSMACSEYMDDNRVTELMSSPNNILAIEYCRAIDRLSSTIIPEAVKRTDMGYHSMNSADSYLSATGIRNLLNECNDIKQLENYVPYECYKLYNAEYRKSFPVNRKDYMSLLLPRLMTLEYPVSGISDFGQELSNRLENILKKDFSNDFENFINQINSKNETFGHICRSMSHLLLEINDRKMLPCMYARIICFKNSSKELLSLMKTNSCIPFGVTLGEIRAALPKYYAGSSSIALSMIKTDRLAYQLYQSMLKLKFNTEYIPEESLKAMIL